MQWVIPRDHSSKKEMKVFATSEPVIKSKQFCKAHSWPVNLEMSCWGKELRLDSESRQPAPGVPRARALGSREASPRSSVCRAHHSGREAPGLSGFPHPCLAHESRDFKTTGGVVPLIFDPWVSCSLLPFPYIFLCCHFKPQKVVYRFPQKHNPISLSASYVVRPVSGSFSRSF